MRLSKFTIFFALYLIASAAFMRQVWDFWRATFGKEALTLAFILLCSLAGFATLYNSIKRGLSLKRIFLIGLMCVLGFRFAWKQPYMTEKAHILEYGLLSWLALRDLSKGKKILPKNMLLTFIFVSIVGTLDEVFQWILPWRYFETRDILTNIISGVIGMAVFILEAK